MNARAQFPSGLLPSGTEVVLRQSATPQSRDQAPGRLDVRHHAKFHRRPWLEELRRLVPPN
jgi:hypothetical protein